jgi:hypothetical protein
MSKRVYNYIPENIGIYGDFLSYKFDAIDIVSRNTNGYPTQIDFYQNGISLPISRKVMSVYVTYDTNGYKKTIEVEDFITVHESNIF